MVGVLDPMRGNVHEQDGVGAAVAHVAAGGQLGLLVRGQALAAVRADQQPGRALAGGGPIGVVGERGDAVQRRVHPPAPRHHRHDEHQQERQHEATPMPFAARLFRLRWGRRLFCHRRRPVRRPTGRRRRCRDAGAVAAGAVDESAGSVATRGVAGSSGHGGSLRTALGAPWGRDPGPAAGCRSQHEIYDSQPRWPAASA